MASLVIALPVGNVVAATSNVAKGSSEKKKGFLDWLGERLQREQLLETDPILRKGNGEGNGNARPPSGRVAAGKKGGSASSSSEDKKSGGGPFGGLFGKK
uniref:Thylakoid soluble phosphoprotein TSP9 n=1 Tax=Picea sitchensis TaxID=3332 RepID=A9NY03_PICSI|nr:unknown [Picea sitchensis]